MLGSKGAWALIAGLLGTAVVLGWRQTPGSGASAYMAQQAPGLAYAQDLSLREVNSPAYQPPGGGPVIRGYIDESPLNPNEFGGQPVIPHRYGVQHQQASGLL